MSKTMDLYDRLEVTEPSMRDRLVFFMRGSAVKRFHTAITITENTVGQHEAGCALFCDLLSNGDPSVDLLRAALYHDHAEQVVGDVPAPTKRWIKGLRAELKEVEEGFLNGYLYLRPLGEREEFILKLADNLDGMMFTIKEVMMGNRFMEYTLRRWIKYTVEMLPDLNRDCFDIDSSARIREVVKQMVYLAKEALNEC